MIKLEKVEDGTVRLSGSANIKEVFDYVLAVIRWACLVAYENGVSENEMCKVLVRIIADATKNPEEYIEDAKKDNKEAE